MFAQLAQPYRTNNNDLIFIKASQATVINIAKAFAQSRLLDIELARRTRAFYVEPENLLTITVPTGLPKKTDLSWGTCRHLPDLSTKRVGNPLPKSLLKTAFARQLGQKTKRAIRLNTPATDSSACPRRSPTSMSYSPMQ